LIFKQWLKNWAKEWKDVVQVVGIIVGVIAVMVAGIGGYFAYQQLVTANNQLHDTTPSSNPFSGHWYGGESVLSWDFNMIPYRSGTIYLSATGTNCTATLEQHEQFTVTEDNFSIIGQEGSYGSYCATPNNWEGVLLILPMLITQPGLNINVQLKCTVSSPRCGSLDIKGQIVFYP